MKTFILFVSLVLIAPTTWSAEPYVNKDMSGMMMDQDMNKALSKEDREKMAAGHAKMAACLRSNQDFSKCHDDLRQDCQSMMGGSCPGMQMGSGMHKGMKLNR